MIKSAGSIFLITVLAICLQVRIGFAEIVNSYENLLTVLSEGKNQQHQEKISNIILNAQKMMIEQYCKQNVISSAVSRYFKFKEPIAIHPISDQYLAISFNAEMTKHNYKNKVIWVLFFNRPSPGEINYADNFLSWEKPVEIDQYNRFPDMVFCNQLKAVYGINCQNPDIDKTKPAEGPEQMQNIVTKAFLEKEMAKKADIGHVHSGSEINAGKINANFIDETICRDSELNEAIAALNNGGNEINKTNVVFPLPASQSTVQRITLLESQMKKNAALKAEVIALRKTVQQLASLLAGVTRHNDEIIFSGVNIHLVNGNNATDGKPNGRGNLVIGYNEASTSKVSNARNGSHNIIVGKNHAYTSFGGLVLGESNSISAPCAVVSGGFNNTSSGKFSTVSGGQLNTAAGDYSTVSGGLTRKAENNNNWAGGNQYSPN